MSRMSWTTEQVAEHLNITVEEVYASRRRGDFPGKLGQRRGKRLIFDPDAIQNPVPDDDNSTDDVLVAILWELQAQTRHLQRLVKATGWVEIDPAAIAREAMARMEDENE